MTRSQAAKASKVSATEDASTSASEPKRVRNPAIRWVQQDIDLIVAWFCERNKEGIAVNYEAFVTSNHMEVAERMLYDTDLINKNMVTKKKAADKLENMVNGYKDIRTKAEGSGWGTDPEVHKERDLNSPHGSTVSDLILKKCPWFYEFETLFGDHPAVNPPIIIESGQLPRRNGQPVEEADLGGIQDENAEKDEEEKAKGQSEDERMWQPAEESDGASQHSAHSQAEAATRVMETSAAKIILPSLSDDEDYSWLDDVPKKKTPQPLSQVLKTPVRLVLYRSKTAPVETSEHSSSKQAKFSDLAPKEPSKAKANTSKKSDTRKNKRVPSEDSDDEEKNPRTRWKGSKGRLSMAESMLEQAVMEDARFKEQAREDREASERRFQQEQKQRDQHHAVEIAHSQILINESQERANESKERLLRLQLELSKQQQSQGLEGYGSSNTRYM